MLNDVRPPPIDTESAPPNGTHNGRHLAPQFQPNAPGHHHTRSMGAPTVTDPLYAMPFEERGSNFNIAMSIVALSLFAALVLIAWWMLG